MQEFVLTVDKSNWLHPLGFSPRVRVEVSFPGLTGVSDRGHEAVEVYPVGYVEGDDRQYWMEYLDRAGTIEVPAARTQAVYIRFRIPKDMAEGVYEGQVRVFKQFGFEDETCFWQGQIHLRVMHAVLPDPADYSFHLNLWQHLTSLARYYRVPLWSEDHFTIIDRYYSTLAELGQKVVSLVVTEIPWSGQRCYRDRAYPSYLFEHSTVGVRRNPDGRLQLDFQALDRLLALAHQHHMDQQIDVFGLVNIWVDEEFGFGKVADDAPDAVRVRCFDEVTGSFSYLRTAAEISQFIQCLHQHFIDLGVLDRVRIAADEPGDLEAFNRSLAFVREAGPGFHYSAAINHFEFLELAPHEVIDFTPLLPMACQDPNLTGRLTESLHERGGKMTWYVCCAPPIPNTFLHSPLAEARLHGWLTYALHLDGFLRWAFCLWPADPWERVSWRAPGWKAGDMYFVLPGKDGKPVETLRYEGLRLAVQDYELLKLVEHSLSPQQAEAAIQKAMALIFRAESLDKFAQVFQLKAEDLYSIDPADYHAARGVLLEALEQTASILMTS